LSSPLLYEKWWREAGKKVSTPNNKHKSAKLACLVHGVEINFRRRERACPPPPSRLLSRNDFIPSSTKQFTSSLCPFWIPKLRISTPKCRMQSALAPRRRDDDGNLLGNSLALSQRSAWTTRETMAAAQRRGQQAQAGGSVLFGSVRGKHKNGFTERWKSADKICHHKSGSA
jgi:hypothetical protein